MKLSICIPTFNRPEQLPNCLNSILIAKKKASLTFEVCISDNCSSYDVEEIVLNFKNNLNIKLNINKENLGYQPNLQKSIDLASGEFVWAIGDDDLLTPDSLNYLENLFQKHDDVDFYFLNSYHLDYSYLDNFQKPFDTKYLPKNMPKLSKMNKEMKCQFWDLIDYKISFDFLLGNFLNVFKREMWMNNIDCLDQNLLNDKRQWSNFDNTCGHIKIYANAFKNSKAFYTSKALTCNGYGVREWVALYDLIEIVRLPECLDYYRKCGLNFLQYIKNKNYALRNFSNFFFKILIRGKKAGLNYVNFYRHFFLNLIYPNVYLSIFYFLIRSIRKKFKNEEKK